MLEDSVGAHWHVVVSHVELVHRVKLSIVETHLSHVVLRDVHFIRLFTLGKLLVHCLVLGKRRPCEVGLIHLHLVRSWRHHIYQHCGAPTTIGSSSSVRHATDECLALKSHAHLTHLLEVHRQWVNLLIHHIVDAHLRLPTTLLGSHWQMITLIHCVLVLAFL